MTKIKIMLADDHTIVRSGLKDILERVPEFELIGEASNGNEVLEMLRHKIPNLLLTDLSMPGISGADLIHRVRSHYPKLPILVLTMMNDAQMASRIIKAGADGYITKDCSPEELISSVRKVVAGGKHLDPKLAEQMLFHHEDQESLHSTLSNRELDVLKLMLQGSSSNHIGELLSISNKTVSTHKSKILRKMGMSNTTDLVRYAVQHDLFAQDGTARPSR